MANPAEIPCAADVWTLVAENVTSGQIKRVKTDPNVYLITYKTTGEAAPVVSKKGIPVFVGVNSESISAASGIDVYIKPLKVRGSVEVQI